MPLVCKPQNIYKDNILEYFIPLIEVHIENMDGEVPMWHVLYNINFFLTKEPNIHKLVSKIELLPLL